MGTTQVQDEIKKMPDEGYSNPASLPGRFLYLPLSAWLLIIFFLLVFLKTCLIFFYPNGPAVFSDELLYKEQARQIFSGQAHYGRLYDWRYPPLYPISLSLAFLSKEHWYEWMLFINTLPILCIREIKSSGKTDFRGCNALAPGWDLDKSY